MADVQISGNEILLTQMKAYFSAVQDNLETKQKESIQSMMLELETLNQKAQNAVSKTDIEPIAKRMNDISTQMTQIAADAKANQTVIDNWIIEQQKAKSGSTDKKSFSSVWDEDVIKPLMESKSQGMVEGQRFSFKMKNKPSKLWVPGMDEKGIMTTSNTLTGTGYTTFNQRQGLVPGQQINFRDLLSTTTSDNGSYITYRETNTVQSTGKQTEGSAKANLQYTFSAVTATLAYLAGFATFTKQLLYNLGFLETRLPTMLLRDFYKKENDYLFTTIAGNSTGTYTGSGTVDAEELINTIASQRKANFNASYAIIDWAQWGRLLTTKPNDYSIPGGMVVTADGTIIVAGVPVVAATWAQTDHVLVYDYDYYERVEGESINVTFSMENQDNFEKNQVTARIECYEEINRLRDDASIYRDFGNS